MLSTGDMDREQGQQQLVFCCSYRDKQVNGVSGNLVGIEGSQVSSLFLLQV